MKTETNNEITAEQTKKIAEWLGYELSDQIYVRDWLSSPEGETTMIHKILEPNELNMNISKSEYGYRVRVTKFSFYDSSDNMLYQAQNKNLNKALQLVILEILEGQACNHI